jgi:hypothetical protein
MVAVVATPVLFVVASVPNTLGFMLDSRVIFPLDHVGWLVRYFQAPVGFRSFSDLSAHITPSFNLPVNLSRLVSSSSRLWPCLLSLMMS